MNAQYAPREARMMEAALLKKWTKPHLTKPKPQSDYHQKREERRKQILDVLTDEPMSRADIQSHLPDLTENMYQGDMKVLVARGQVRRIGESWKTRYARLPQEGTT